MRLRRSLLLLLACLPGAWVKAGGNDFGTLVQADSGLGTAGLVGAIMAYTAWPPRERALVLCISRQAPDASTIQSEAQQLKLRWPLQTRLVEADELPAPACDAVYFDRWSLPAQRAALLALAGRPVLSIGWGGDFCTDGGLVCLSPGRTGLRFELNLDGVARSGLRLHPQVLRLTQPRSVERS